MTDYLTNVQLADDVGPDCRCTTLLWYAEPVDTGEVLDRIAQLLNSDMSETSNTSMRIPTPLREAAALAAAELKLAPSATALTTMALQATLETALRQAALDEHYAQYPETRPTLENLAIAAANLDGNPLAEDPDRIRRAAAELASVRPDPDPDDVLIWAEARAFRA